MGNKFLISTKIEFHKMNDYEHFYQQDMNLEFLNNNLDGNVNLQRQISESSWMPIDGIIDADNYDANINMEISKQECRAEMYSEYVGMEQSP